MEHAGQQSLHGPQTADASPPPPRSNIAARRAAGPPQPRWAQKGPNLGRAGAASRECHRAATRPTIASPRQGHQWPTGSPPLSGGPVPPYMRGGEAGPPPAPHGAGPARDAGDGGRGNDGEEGWESGGIGVRQSPVGGGGKSERADGRGRFSKVCCP
nr:translation initiation factor IF-2-like [Aegilops tauschii subsp. strangulata]